MGYAQPSHEMTCRDVPIYITNSIYSLCILAFSSMVMVLRKSAWKSDIDIFLKISNHKSGEDILSKIKDGALDEDNSSTADEIFLEEDTRKNSSLRISLP